jgi:hypothetical protein
MSNLTNKMEQLINDALTNTKENIIGIDRYFSDEAILYALLEYSKFDRNRKIFRDGPSRVIYLCNKCSGRTKEHPDLLGYIDLGCDEYELVFKGDDTSSMEYTYNDKYVGQRHY